MIEVIDFYSGGAQVVKVDLRVSPATFAVEKDLSEIGYSPSKDSKKAKKASAHIIADHGILVLNKGHKYEVKIDGKSSDVDAKRDHVVIDVSNADNVSVKSDGDKVSIKK